MLQEWGPLFRFDFVIMGTIVALLAAGCWISGHISWMEVNSKKIPSWVFSHLGFNEKLTRQTKSRNIYIMKGIAWIINLFWIWSWLLAPRSSADIEPFTPVFGQVFLVQIGGVILELMIFFVLIGLFWWVTREK